MSANPTQAILNLDIDVLFKKINDIVVKTIISAEPLLWNGIEMYVPNTYQFDTSSQIDTKKKNNNCFELLGFDILVDQQLKPWLLEINRTPALGCRLEARCRRLRTRHPQKAAPQKHLRNSS